MGGLPANIDLHHFAKRNAVLAPIVKLRGAGRGMRRHLDKTVALAGFARSVLRDFVGLLRELSMGVTEAQALELPHRRRSRARRNPSVTDVVWPAVAPVLAR